MPPLATLLAIGGPYFGLVPASLEYPFSLFYGLVALTVICTWPLPYPSGRIQISSFIVLLLATLLANMVAIVLIEGSAVNVYMGVITVAFSLGWAVQFRVNGDGLKCRVRVGAHIIYYYGLDMIMGLGFLLLGLVMAEVFNQSVLQSEPLMPGLAAMIGYPSMSSEATTG